MKAEIATLRGEIDALSAENKSLHRMRPLSTASQMPPVPRDLVSPSMLAPEASPARFVTPVSPPPPQLAQDPPDNFQSDSTVLREKLREKEDEVKILWSVIKDFNRRRSPDSAYKPCSFHPAQPLLAEPLVRPHRPQILGLLLILLLLRGRLFFVAAIKY